MPPAPDTTYGPPGPSIVTVADDAGSITTTTGVTFVSGTHTPATTDTDTSTGGVVHVRITVMPAEKARSGPNRTSTTISGPSVSVPSATM